MNELSLTQDILHALPLVAGVLCFSLVVLLEAIFKNAHLTRFSCFLSLCIILGLSLVGFYDKGTFAFQHMVKIDSYAKLCFSLISTLGIILLLFPVQYSTRKGFFRGEYYAVMLSSLIGMMFMVSASHFVMLFLGVEIMSISFYVLSGALTNDQKSNEAAFKYFILGAFSSGFFLYGVALIYGSIGTLEISGVNAIIWKATQSKTNVSVLFYVGIVFLFIGLLFKVSAFPFHQWVTDVYEGSPTSSTALMASIGKSAMFLTLCSVSLNFFVPIQQTEKFRLGLSYIAIASMLVGNIAAINQTNLKRLLAYSSIGHIGFLLIGIIAGGSLGYTAAVSYSIIYGITNLGAFGVLLLLEHHLDITSLDQLSGLREEKLSLAILLSIFMLSLAGMPPTAGFIAKYNIFMTAMLTDHLLLGIVGLVASAISLAYYLKIIYYSFKTSNRLEPLYSFSSIKFYTIIPIIAVAIAVLVIGTVPNFFSDIIETSLKTFFIK